MKSKEVWINDILELHKETEKYPNNPVVKQLRKDIELCFVNAYKKLL